MIINSDVPTTRVERDWLGRQTLVQDTDKGTWTYTYDANGNVKTQTDAKLKTIAFTYDALNRVTRKDYPETPLAGQDVRYYYDGDDNGDGTIDRAGMKGLLGYVTDSSGNTKNYYDTRNRVIKTEKIITGLTAKTTEYGYDSMDRLKKIKYPGDSGWAEYTFDLGGAVKTLNDAGSNNIVSSITYNGLGRTAKTTYPSNAFTEYLYNGYAGNYRLNTLTIKNGAGGVLSSPAYTYDKVGNISKIDDTGTAWDQTFTYDDLNRLTGQTNAGFAGGTGSYSYDNFDRITNKDGKVYNYSGNIYNKLHAVTSVTGGSSYTYDANGNMITAGSNTYGYD
ncbi:MAG: hypothetical protein CVV37_08410, partial [Nitrospira bacterium HGW-Nitrospira-1]